MVYYAVDTYYTEEILDNMHSIGCDGDMLRTAYENISSGNLNTGVTYSNFGTRETVMVIALTSSPKEFAKSWRHECGHMATHICQAFGIDPYGEEIQYIGDDIIEKTWEYVKSLLCECNCCKSKVISLSKEIEKYVMGEADLPEAYDPSEMLKNSMEMLNKRFTEDYDKNKELQAKADEVSTRTGGDA